MTCLCGARRNANVTCVFTHFCNFKVFVTILMIWYLWCLSQVGFFGMFTSMIMQNAQTKHKSLNAQTKGKRSYVNFFAKVQMLKKQRSLHTPKEKKKEKKLAPS